MKAKKEKTHIATNLKYLRSIREKSLSELAKICDKTDVAVYYWENGLREPNAVDIAKLSNYYNITVDDLLLKDLRVDNSRQTPVNNTIQIPVLKTIKPNIPIEEQQNIIEYIDIPKKWTFKKKDFFSLKINNDNMSPKYNKNDIVIFEQIDDISKVNNKDCLVIVNDEVTFKKVLLNETGIILVPYNTNLYDMKIYAEKEIKIIGIAIEKRTKI